MGVANSILTVISLECVSFPPKKEEFEINKKKIEKTG